MNTVDGQVIDYVVRLESKYTSRRMNSYFVVLTLIRSVTTLSVLFETSVLQKFVRIMISVIISATFLSLCNKVTMSHGLLSFQSIYRIIQIMLGCLGLQIMNDYYYSRYTSNNKIEPSYYIAGVCYTLAAGLRMMVVIIINDGYNANIKLKITFLIVELVYLTIYLVEAVSKSSEASFGIFSSGYSIMWKNIAVSALATTIVFICKQVYSMIKHPDKFGVIICYLPVIPMERTVKHDRHTDTSVQMQHLHLHSGSNDRKSYKFNHLWSVGSSNLDSSSTTPNRLTLINGQPTLLNNANTDEINLQLNISPVEASLDLGLLSLEKNPGYKDTLDVIDSASEGHPIYLDKQRTLWVVLFNKTCFRGDTNKSLKLGQFFTKKVLQIILAAIIGAFAVKFTVLDWDIDYACGIEWYSGLLSFMAGTAIVVMFLTINVDCCVYLLKTRFSIYWRLYDTLASRVGNLIIVYKNMDDICGSNGMTTTASLFWELIWECIFMAIFGTLILSMMQSYLNIHLLIRLVLVAALGVGLWFQISIWHLTHDETTQVSITMFGDKYSLELNDFVAVHSFDASLWFSWQFFMMIKHRNEIRVANATRKWTVIA